MTKAKKLKPLKPEPEVDELEIADFDPPSELRSPAFVAPNDRGMNEQEATDALAMLAATIKNDFDFIRVLRDADPGLRHEVYKKLKPLVGYIPRPFHLMKFEADA